MKFPSNLTPFRTSLHRNAEISRGQLCGPTAAEWLSTGPNFADISTARQTLVVDQIFKEIIEVRLEVGLPILGDEAEDGSRSVRALEQIPVCASNIDRTDR